MPDLLFHKFIIANLIFNISLILLSCHPLGVTSWKQDFIFKTFLWFILQWISASFVTSTSAFSLQTRFGITNCKNLKTRLNNIFNKIIKVNYPISILNCLMATSSSLILLLHLKTAAYVPCVYNYKTIMRNFAFHAQQLLKKYLQCKGSFNYEFFTANKISTTANTFSLFAVNLSETNLNLK